MVKHETAVLVAAQVFDQKSSDSIKAEIAKEHVSIVLLPREPPEK